MIVERTSHPRARFASSLAEAEAVLRTEMRAGDVMMLLGAGDINTLSTRLLSDAASGSSSEAQSKAAAAPRSAPAHPARQGSS